jgi:hypothetical protein
MLNLEELDVTELNAGSTSNAKRKSNFECT